MIPHSRSLSLFLFSALCTPLAAQTMLRASEGAGGVEGLGHCVSGKLSADGRYVAFASFAPNLVAGDTNIHADVFVRDLLLSTTVRVSVDSSGAEAVGGDSLAPSISSDGRFVSFWSAATNLAPGDTNGATDVFVHDMQTGVTTRVSVSSAGVQANNYSYTSDGNISGDGRFVGFSSFANNLVPNDQNGLADAFVHDRLTGQTTRVSVGNTGNGANASSTGCYVSDDGHLATFSSSASNLVTGDTNQTDDVFVRDLVSGTTLRVSIDPAGNEGNGASSGASLTPDGRFVAFASFASNLAGVDTNGNRDVFMRDLLTVTTVRVSLSSGGQQIGLDSSGVSLSADGRYAVFQSAEPSLVAGDSNGLFDTFVRDQTTGATRCVSLTPAGTTGNLESLGGSLSADGQRVCFLSAASNLILGDSNFLSDMFVLDRGQLAQSPFCFGDGTQVTACPCANSGAAGRGCENSSTSGGSLLVASGFAADPDSTTLHASGLVPNALTIFLQGNAQLAGSVFGDGVRCAGGALKRLYIASAVGQDASMPTGFSLPLGLRSAQLGDPIAHGTSRFYQAWYRDANASFCAAPLGGTSNISNGVQIDW
ncbi:MAG: PD40 domain-containing protein [Planctomycetes bacterium]|nr:PD40 domain-containing protein [Planctomycetota bacterium]